MPGPCRFPRPAAAAVAPGVGDGWRELARALAKLLLQSEEEASRRGLCLRSDGYAKLDEALSVACMQEVVEAVAPGGAAALNTGGYGGPMPPALLAAVREAVARTTTGGKPCFDLWEGEVHGSHEFWVSCGGEPDAEQEVAAEAPAPPAAAAPECGGGGGATEPAAAAHVPKPRRVIDVRLREAEPEPATEASQQWSRQYEAEAEAPVEAVAQEPAATGAEADAGDGSWDWWKPQGAAVADAGSSWTRGGAQPWWEQASSNHSAKRDAQGDDEEYLPAPIMRLSKNLVSLLRHRAAEEGLCVRTDGFAKLDEVLSLSCMQRVLEHVAPNSAGPLNTNGAGGPIDEELLGMVREMVGTSHSKGRPRFELWEGEGDGGETDVWIRAMHKHSLAHVTEVPSNAEPETVADNSEAQEWTKENTVAVEEAHDRRPSTLTALLGDSRALASRAGGRESGEQAAAAVAAAAAAAAAAATPAERPCVVPRRVMAPRVVPPAQRTAAAAAPAPRETVEQEGAPMLLGNKKQEPAALGGVEPSQHREAFRDILNVLPKDAPANVRAYLASLATA